MIWPKNSGPGGSTWGPLTSLLRCLRQEGAMRFKNSYRPQNLHPDGLVQSRKQVAEQHYQQVRVTVQAMLRRGMKPHEITIPAVAKEANVSAATIYRRADLFILVQHANPAIQRRQTERVYRKTIQ